MSAMRKKKPRRILKKGLVQVYTGNGKGKSTAAFGLAIRAAGAGMRVFICQFIKGMPCSEIKALKAVKNINIEQYGSGYFIKGKPAFRDIKCAEEGLARIRSLIKSGLCDLVILDEVNIAIKFGLLKSEDIIDIICKKPGFVELVLTGRYCPQAIFKYADLVTEMREIKHPYKKGIKARKGIEY